MANIVAIVGRPNVGKSTFFNRLIGERKAIMDNMPGVTRDRHYGQADWLGKNFTLIDTGGYVEGSDDVFEEAIRSQVKLAIEECKVILFMVDAVEGVHPLDEEFARVLRMMAGKKPVYLVVNKADTNLRANMAGEFYALGMDEPYPISSMTGSGTGELLDAVVSHFTDEGIENPDEGIPRIAVVGRPNAGKSSFINVLLGVDRNIVTEVAGTTRDAIDTRYKAYGKNFILTDTAGIRKKGKMRDEQIEFYSVLRSISAIEESDVCVVMLDASRGLESQDLNIIYMAEKNKKGIVILVNKWDLIEKDSKTADHWKKDLKEKLGTLAWIPIMFISVMSKQRIFQAIEKAIEVFESRKTRIATSKLNEAILPEIESYPPPSVKGKYIKIKYATQLPTPYPTFAFFCNLPQYIKEPYQRFIENRLREQFGFEGVPIQIFFRKK